MNSQEFASEYVKTLYAWDGKAEHIVSVLKHAVCINDCKYVGLPGETGLQVAYKIAAANNWELFEYCFLIRECLKEFFLERESILGLIETTRKYVHKEIGISHLKSAIQKLNSL